MGYEHQTVLLAEAVDALQVVPDGRYVDGTFGRGGHSRAILARLGPDGRLLAIDRDPQAVAAGRELAGTDSRLKVVYGNFASLASAVDAEGWRGCVNGVLLDLGVSSPQLDDPSRGFSFMRDGPLDMRMDTGCGEDAAGYIARATVEELEAVFRDFGEERFARRIAQAIVRERAQRPLVTTRALAELVAAAVPSREPGKHPATRVFQALRIRINNELAHVADALGQALDVLAPAGRLVVISFHSLEDRIVKRFMQHHARGPELPRGLPVQAAAIPTPLALVGKAVRAREAEVAANARARSAVMRIAERREVAHG